MHTLAMGEGGKFEHLNALLAAHPADGFDWLIVVDDDVVLPRGFLDRFLHCAEDAGLVLAQPAHRLHSHAAWEVTRRRPGGAVRESRFAEIGPVSAFAAESFQTLLPFPELRMGWGLDAHWAALAREHGWPVGIVDATPMLHTTPVGGGYARADAVAEATTFLASRPYVTRGEARWSQRVR
jgi:GT2 family glycosyltransferase